MTCDVNELRIFVPFVKVHYIFFKVKVLQVPLFLHFFTWRGKGGKGTGMAVEQTPNVFLQ